MLWSLVNLVLGNLDGIVGTPFAQNIVTLRYYIQHTHKCRPPMRNLPRPYFDSSVAEEQRLCDNLVVAKIPVGSNLRVRYWTRQHFLHSYSSQI